MTTKEALEKCCWVKSCFMKRETPPNPDLMYLICSAVAALEEKLPYEKTALDAANIKSGK